MAHRHMKKCSASLAIREMQLKTTMRYHLTPTKMSINKQQVLSRMWGKGNLVHCWWECRLVQPLWERVWSFLTKLKMELPYDPVIPLLGIYPKNPETPIINNISTPMCIAALFTIVKIWK